MPAFKTQKLLKPTIFQRVFSIKPKENGLIEINNLLANNEVRSVSLEQFQGIADNYKLNLHKKHKPGILDMYGKYLRYCFNDQHLSEEEIESLKYLKFLFGLKDHEIDSIHNEIAGEIYKSEVDNGINDGRLSESEEQFLLKLQNDLKLPDKISSKIYKESAQVLLDKFLEGVVSDQRLSPDEESELEAICKNLNVNLTFEEKTQAALDKFKLYWQIENGEIPEVNVPISIQKSEKCYFYTPCEWLEQRRITTRINYSGPTARIKIMKGLYWRAGSLNIQPVSRDEWKVIDSGNLYLTNKRIIFIGSKGNKTVRLNRILDLNLFSDGVHIQKNAGRSPFLAFKHNTDIFSMILGRAIVDY